MPAVRQSILRVTPTAPKAISFQQLGGMTQYPPKNLMRMLSPNGNPAGT